MSRIAPSSTGRTPMERLMGHAPHILVPWTKLEDAFFASRTFSPALLEQVRRTLALAHGCRYCQAKGGPPDHSHADSRTAAAVELADHFARDQDRKSTRLNSSHLVISYAVFCLKKKIARACHAG